MHSSQHIESFCTVHIPPIQTLKTYHTFCIYFYKNSNDVNNFTYFFIIKNKLVPNYQIIYFIHKQYTYLT